jgi:hypothetical protein
MIIFRTLSRNAEALLPSAKAEGSHQCSRNKAPIRNLRFSAGQSAAFLSAKSCSAKQIAHYFGGAGQSGVERGRILTTSLRHVWTAAAGTAYLLRQGPDDFPRGETAGEIARHSGDEGYLSVFLG